MYPKVLIINIRRKLRVRPLPQRHPHILASSIAPVDLVDTSNETVLGIQLPRPEFRGVPSEGACAYAAAVVEGAFGEGDVLRVRGDGVGPVDAVAAKAGFDVEDRGGA